MVPRHIRRVVALTFALIAALARPSAAASPPAFRIADIETSVDTRGSSSPLLQARLGDWLYFSATDSLHGEELWRTDGTAAGTQLVADICPGRCSSHPRNITAGAGRLFFSVELELLGREPWSSDGTAAGTHALGDLCPGSCWSVYATPDQRPVTLGNVTLFVAGDLVAGRELWRTDGTPAGTRRVADVWPGSNGSDPATLTAFAGRAYFAAREPAHGVELWSSDGTAAGTRLVNDFANGPFGSQVAVLGAIERGLLLIETSNFATDLWVVDPAGQLRPLGDVPCHADCAEIEVEDMGDWMALSSGNALWRTDLTPTGTLRLLALPIGLDSGPHDLTRAGGRVFFRGDTSGLWVSDGTAAGTRIVHSLGLPNGASTGPLALTALGDGVAFVASTSARGAELWISDGTEAGTRLVDLAADSATSLPAPYDAIPQTLAELGGRVLFPAFNAETGRELWISDASATAAHLLADIHRDAGSNPAGLAAWHGRLHFSAQRDGSGFDAWTSDGTAAGTALLRDLPEASGPSRERVEFGDRLYFAADDPPAIGQLWRTDGTAAGTEPLDGTDGSAHAFTVLGSRLLLLANPEDQGCYEGDCSELMALDAGADEVSLVKEINPSYSYFPYWPTLANSAGAHDLTVLGDRLLFAADDGGFDDAVGNEPWISDGTPAGTRPLLDLCPGPCGSFPRAFARLGSHVLFVTGDQSKPHQLWRTDGTAAGTVPLHTFAAGDAFGGPLASELAVAGSRAYFVVSNPPGDELWASDGTAAGTVRVSDLALDGSPARARHLAGVGDRLYFAVYHASTGEELWTSDGTAAGTRMIADLAPGAASSTPTSLTAIDGLLVFAAADGGSGLEPWISDGTETGTYRLQDIAPGAASSSPEEFTRFGDLLVFTAGDPEHGRELWAARWADVATGRCVATATTLCLQGGRFAVTVRWKTASAAGDGHAVPRTDESGLFWFFGAANTELIVKVLDGGAVNGKFWVFFNSLSDVEYDVDVVEAASGVRRTYHHAPGNLCGQADTSAFPAAAAAAGSSGAADSYTSGTPRSGISSRLESEALDGEAVAVATTTSAASNCVASPTTLCLQHSRFAVRVDFLDPLHGGAVTAALAIPDGEESGLFSFFGGANFELGVKVLDGRPVNGWHWLFHAALTDVDYTLRASDTTTGVTRTYHHAPGQLCGGADTSAF